MKRWEYSGGWKFLAVVLNQVCAVILVLSVIVCTLYLGSGGFEFFDRGERFENTVYYQNEVDEQIYRCIRAVSRESKFERAGVYDPDLVVDIEEYVQNNRILESVPGTDSLCYKLSDLLSWAQEGYEIETVMKITYQDGSVVYISKGTAERTEQSVYDEDGSVVSSSSTVYGAEETYEEFAAETSAAKEAAAFDGIAAYDGDTLEIAEISGRSQSAIQDVEQIESVEERFMPIGYGSIAEYAEVQHLSTQELQSIYWNLENTL